MIQNGKLAATRRSLWNRVRVQLSAGLLIAVFLPYGARYLLDEGFGFESLQNSLVGTIIALIGGYYGFRRLSRYPGARASYYIVPSFAVSYGLVMATFFFLRIDYSRFHFIASFLLCVVWYYVVYFQLHRQRRLRFGVVPFGDIGSLFGIAEVDWVRLTDGKATPSLLDGIVADLRAEIPDEWERFLTEQALRGTLVMHVKQLVESLTGKVQIEHLSENNLGSLIPGIIYAKVKRVGDLAISIVALPLIVPLFILTAVLIRSDSPGPIFFRQERMGYRGRTFRMVKFRTMAHADGRADDARDAAMTRDEDDRVTRIGRVLRRYRLDELPQIINILKGEMSWIGPRPEAVPLSQWYEAELPFYRYRHIVRPGITGWAQIRQGHVAEVNEVLEKLHYDFYYIRNFSFWLDILIVAGTFRTVFSGFGAK